MSETRGAKRIDFFSVNIESFCICILSTETMIDKISLMEFGYRIH